MLLGIDHVTFNFCRQKISLRKRKKLFDIKKVKNHPYKKIFLRKYRKDHEISFYTTKKNEVDIEITKYHNTKKNFNKFDVLNLKKNIIIICSNSPKKDKIFLKKVFEIKNEIFSIFNKKKFKIIFKKKNFNSTYLDDEGYVALAFVVSNVGKYYKIVKNLNIKCTKVFHYKIFGNHTKIFFLKLHGGLIIELIEYL